MFIGHFGLGFAAKKIRPELSLATLFFASQFIDLLWPFLLMLGLEKVEIAPGLTPVTPLNFIYYPFSHSMVMVIFWSGVVGGIYWLIKRNRLGAFLLSGLVFSHWVLDLIVHLPDLPLFPGDSPKVGLGLWNSLVLSQFIEFTLFSLGVLLYSKSTRARNKTGTWSLAFLVLFFLMIQGMNLVGPPPPNAGVIAYTAHLQWLFVLWAAWVDRNRMAV